MTPACAQGGHDSEWGGANASGYRYFVEGLRLESAGDLNGAIEAYKRAASRSGRVKEIHHNLAKLYARTGNTSMAFAEFQAALTLDYNYVECRNNFGAFCKKIGKLQDAEASFRQCINIDPKFPYAYYNLGKMLKEKGDLDGAISNFETATNLKPDFAEAQEALGMAVFERASQGDLSQAMEKLETAARLVPKNPRIHYHLGQIYATKSDLDKAENEFRTSLMCDPRFAASHWELGKLRYYRGDLDRALGEIKQALSVNPTYTQNQEYPDLEIRKVLTLEAQIYEHMGDPVNAVEIYKRLQTMLRSQTAYADKIKSLEREARRLAGEQKHHPLPYDPQEVDAMIAKGIEAYEDGDLDQSRASFERALELNPKSFRAIQNLSFVQEAQGDLNNALATAQKATALNPDYDGALYNLAYLLEKSNLPDEAAHMYERFRTVANAYPYDSQHIIDLQQNIIREQKRKQALRRRGY
jgi:tetratricopeptide (TPR) repeat protein